MPYTTVVAGTYATASWANANVRDQVITSFASTGNRDATITSPVEGMVCYVGSNDANEGLYTYNGTSWRKGPGWNAPWGIMASVTQSGALVTTSATTEITVTNTASFSSIANRNYLFTVSTSCYDDVASGSQFTFRLRNGSLTGTSLMAQIVSTSLNSYTPLSFSFVNTLSTASSNGLFLTMQRTSGTGRFNSNATASPALITMTDIGPSGAPV
ncbi:hypothetical protein UFOVP196_25 [uncultured Caudovirales phage]|uniref:Uncharacterized protein n=1 Tax=uncultured Caudovirales phage TaxID=2100421 RepID=A0A6J7WFV1_9CAUD|nr:hypothetical protein UFOVP196_25 [uncultured Caudovirales phage]